MAISRAELEAMDRDELVDTVVELSETVADLQTSVETLRDELEDESESRRDGDQLAAQDRKEIKSEIADARDDLDDEISTTADVLHRERSKLARRVSALEDEVGVTTADALATAEAGEDAHTLTKLGRLVRHGPEAVSDNPSAKMYRARELVDNWDRWGTIRSDAVSDPERRLASKQHDLKTRLEDTRGESLAWRQVYRAMQLIEEWSGPNVSLREGSEDEGKYVLVHRLQEDDA
jgi:hypothetical protein